MRILCCDPYKKLFFIAVNKQELEEQILPLHQDLLEEYAHDTWKHLYVSAPWLRDEELDAQAKIKVNPFTSETVDFSRFIHESCDADAYIVVSADLMQLYFVPFNYFSPFLWKDDGDWNAIDKRDIKLISEIADVPFALHGKAISLDPNHKWTNGDAEELLADYEEKLPRWKNKGPQFVFNMVMSQLRKNHLWPREAQKLMVDGRCVMPPWFWELDYAHLMIQGDYFLEKPPKKVAKLRTIEEEEAMLGKLNSETNAWVTGERLALDYLDGYITWDMMVELFDNHPDFEAAKNMSEPDRRKWLWLSWYDPECPFNKK